MSDFKNGGACAGQHSAVVLQLQILQATFVWRTKCEDLRLFVIDGGRKNPE